MAKRIQDFREFNSSRAEAEPSKQKNTNQNSYKSKVNKSAKTGTSRKNKPKETKNIGRGSKEFKQEKEKGGSSKFFVAFFIILVLVGVGLGCLFSPTFNLSEITAKNGINVTSGEILNSFSIQMGTNVFKINYKHIEEAVEKLPYVQSADAKLEIPSQIKIEYVEREPFALVKYLESYLIMDKFGYILEISREKKFENLPIIYNIEFDSYEIGGRLEDTAKTKYDNVVYLLENALKNDFNYSISEINYESISNVKMWVREEDVEIIYGEIDRNIIIDKLNYISEILNKIKGKGGTLDISSDNYLEKTVFTERL